MDIYINTYTYKYIYVNVLHIGLSEGSKIALENTNNESRKAGKYNFIDNKYELATIGSQTHRSGKSGVTSKSFVGGSSYQGTRYVCMYLYIYIYIYMCLYLCIYICI
jgi:hypothetical protein